MLRRSSYRKEGKRVDYKLLNEGVGDEEEESFWSQGHITDLKLLSGDVDLAEVTTKPEDEGNSDSHDAEGAIGPDILEMRKELQALQQEEKQLKDQMSEAEMLRKQIAQKKEDVQKLRGEAIQSRKSNFAKNHLFKMLQILIKLLLTIYERTKSYEVMSHNFR
jgi:hypothetical protein